MWEKVSLESDSMVTAGRRHGAASAWGAGNRARSRLSAGGSRKRPPHTGVCYCTSMATLLLVESGNRALTQTVPGGVSGGIWTLSWYSPAEPPLNPE